MKINLVQRRIATVKDARGESETGTLPRFQILLRVSYCASGGSAWLITRFTAGKARRNARSISSTFS